MENPNEPKKSKFSEQPHYFQWGLTAFCVIGCCVLVAFVLIKLPFIWNVVKKLFGALSPFIYGFVMAYLLMPVFNMLYRRIQPPMSRKFTHGTRIAKGISSLLTLIIGLAVVAGLLWMVLPQLVVSIFSIVESADTYMNDVSNWVTGLLKDNPVIARNFMQVYEQFSEQLVNWVQNIALPHLVTMMTGVVTTVSVVVDILIGIIIALYILNGKETFCAQAKKMTYSLFSIDRANSIIERVAYIHRVFGGFITGKIIDAVVDKPSKLPQLRKFLNALSDGTASMAYSFATGKLDDRAIPGRMASGFSWLAVGCLLLAARRLVTLTIVQDYVQSYYKIELAAHPGQLFAAASLMLCAGADVLLAVCLRRYKRQCEWALHLQRKEKLPERGKPLR